MTDFLFRAPGQDNHIDTWEGLHAFLTSRPPRPDMPAAEDYRGMSAAERDRFNLRRQDYIIRGMRVATAADHSAMKLYRRLLIGNVDAHSHSGLIIDGRYSTGKTTQCRHLMEQTHERYLDRIPDYDALGHIPIAYVEAPPNSSGRALMVAILRFYGGTVGPKDTTDTLQHKVIKIMQKAHTRLLVIDEFQNIADKNKGNGETVDYIKELHNAVNATFILSGIDVVNSDVLQGRRGGQLLSRFVRHETTTYAYDTDDAKREWKGILKRFDNALPLYGAGTLVKHAGLLHDRTKGSIGSLAKMLRGAAIEAISEAADPDDEILSEDLIRSWHVDVYAEYASTPRSAKPAA